MIHTHTNTNTNTNIVKSDPAFCQPGPFVLLFSIECLHIVISEKFNINEKKNEILRLQKFGLVDLRFGSTKWTANLEFFALLGRSFSFIFFNFNVAESYTFLVCAPFAWFSIFSLRCKRWRWQKTKLNVVFVQF